MKYSLQDKRSCRQRGWWTAILWLLMLPLWGQNPTYPVQVTVNAVPPYSLYLSDYVSGSRDRLVVTLLNRDIQYQAMPVRLRLTVKGNGFSLQTRPYASVSQIILEPNVPYRLSVEDLQPYFDTRNLVAQGLGGNGYLNGGRLPEGMIEFGIEVLEYQTSRVLSQKGTAMVWLTLQKPPQLSLPFQNEEVAWRDPLNLMFQWTPQHSGVSRVEYELIIKELWDNGLAPEAAFAYSPEVFRERISSTNYLYGALAPALLPGHRYAWAVKVVGKDGIDDVRIFENDGMSTVRTFRIAQQCPQPQQEKAAAERGYINLEWEGAPEHLSYMVSYRIQGAADWTDIPSTVASAMLPGVRAGKTYEYRVAGFCVENSPTYGAVHTITLPSEDTARMRSCGILPPVDLSDQTPLDRLEPGDYFMAGDFPVFVREVSGGGGYYTGEGYVSVPFLASAQFKVVFDNVFINSSRRMLRGIARTTYDGSESAVGNLDHIFEGGSQAGNVVTGITKTDLSADFRIEEDAGFYWDENSRQIDVTDSDGNHIGYIDVAYRAENKAENPGEKNGNEPSVFPMTVKDKDGNIYQLEEVPDDLPSEGTTAGNAASSASGKKLVAQAVGKVGQELPAGSVNYKHLDTDFGSVEFTDTEGSLYAFDKWEEVYNLSLLIKGKYERLGQNYYVPAKLIPLGKTDKVGARLTITDLALDPAKVVFRTANGTEYKVESYDPDQHFYVLSIAAGASNDAQEVYALYPKIEGGYYNIGKLLVLTYAPYEMKVKIVPVANVFTEQKELESKLKEIFGRVGINCIVEFDEVFEYNNPTLFDKGSGFLSAYNNHMKALNEAYSSQRGTDPSTSYLFVLLYSGQGGDRDFSGFMPRDKQFGYLFRKDFSSVEKFSIAAAHELAHGRLSLKHPFDVSYGLKKNSTSNLMDYADGTHLAKWQWDLIHDPGVVVRLFERDKDAQIIHGITWLGDYLWGIAPDIQEKEIENDLSLYQHVNDQYESYFSQSASSDVSLTLSPYEGWSIRTASHNNICHKVFDKLKSQEAIHLKLNNLGIYLEKHTLENKDYRVVIYSRSNDIDLSSSIRLQSLTSLRKHKEIKAGYTKDFGLIVFYDEEKKMQMLIQIQGGSPKEATLQWLNYLGLVVPLEKEVKEDASLLSQIGKVILHSFPRLSEIWKDVKVENFIVEMYNEGEKFDTNSYQLISAAPAMPNLSFKALGEGVDSVSFQLIIEYKRDIRKDIDYFPAKNSYYTTSLNKEWKVNWNQKIRGGKATLYCKGRSRTDTLVFHIRGTNPTESAVKQYIEEQGYTHVWFLMSLIRQESQYHQFNPGTDYTPDNNSIAGCPNWGAPHGWGLMQLDVLNSTCGLLHRDGKYRPSAEALWNWKKNVEIGYKFLMGEKKCIARNKMEEIDNDLEEWNKKNQDNPVEGHIDQIEGGVTFTHASSPSFTFNWGKLDAGKRSFLDAVWIKSYNGNSQGYYYNLVVPENSKEKPYFTLNRINNENRNYVEDVCRHRD